MTEFLTFDLNEAYGVLKQRAEEQGIIDKEAWDALVEDYVNEKVDIGELDSDQDLEQIELDLEAKYPDYKENMSIT